MDVDDGLGADIVRHDYDNYDLSPASPESKRLRQEVYDQLEEEEMIARAHARVVQIAEDLADERSAKEFFEKRSAIGRTQAE
jgi:hypothetical protein